MPRTNSNRNRREADEADANNGNGHTFHPTGEQIPHAHERTNRQIDQILTFDVPQDARYLSENFKTELFIAALYEYRDHGIAMGRKQYKELAAKDTAQHSEDPATIKSLTEAKRRLVHWMGVLVLAFIVVVYKLV